MSRRLASSTQQAEPGAPVFLAIGKLRRPHGVHGEIIMDILTDFPERLRRGSRLFIGETHQEIRLQSARPNGTTLLVSFAEYTTPETVGVFRNQTVFVPTAELPPLPEGEYYHHQILGLRVISDEGQEVGSVSEILETGANDVFVVRPPVGPEILIPDIDPVILQVNLEKGELLVHLLPGLIDQSEVERDDDLPADPGSSPKG